MYGNEKVGGGIGRSGTDCPTPARVTVAQEVLDFSYQLAERAANLAERVQGKLSGVMVSPAPACNTGEAEKLSREYPPLFSELRGRLYHFQTALDTIEDALSRTEL